MNHKERLTKQGLEYFTSFMAWKQDSIMYKEVYLNRAREAGYTSIAIFQTKKDKDGMYYFEVWTNKITS